MDELDEIMKGLQNLNRLARLKKASETSGFDAEDYLIQENDLIRVRFRPKDNRLWIYSKYRRRDLCYSEYVKGLEYYNGVKVDAIKINDVIDNPTLASDILYDLKAKIIERLYRFGILNVRYHKNMIVFTYNDKCGFHLPVAVAMSFVVKDEIEERESFIGYLANGNSYRFVERGKVTGMLPEFAEITFTEVEKLYERVMSLHQMI